MARSPPHQPVRGVQNCLEDAIQCLRPVSPVPLVISSRTDSGVHALSNSAHFDLQRRNDKPPFAEDIIVDALNHHLKTEQIRVTRAYRVPADFHARFRAVSRTYVYRIAVGLSHHSQLPLTEAGLCWGLRNTELDVGAMREAAALLVGTHDFSSFRALSSEAPFKNPVKTMDVAGIEPGTSFTQTHFHREIQFWELTFKSRSFLYKQEAELRFQCFVDGLEGLLVRRMTGALVAVGQHRLSVPQLKELLEARDSLAFPKGAAAPALGLFLTKVDYRETDLHPSQQPSEEADPTEGR